MITPEHLFEEHALPTAELLGAPVMLAPTGSKGPRRYCWPTKGGSTDPTRVMNMCHTAVTENQSLFAITGERAGNLFVLDGDNPHDLEVLQDEYGEVPVTVTRRSLRPGGTHHYLTHPVDRPVGISPGSLPSGIQVRGQGGGVCFYRDGQPYEWVRGRSPNDVDVAMAPSWLLTLIETPRVGEDGVVSGKEWRRVLDWLPTPAGECHMTQISYLGYAALHNVPIESAVGRLAEYRDRGLYEEAGAGCSADLDDDGLDGQASSIYEKEEQRRQRTRSSGGTR